MDIDKEMSRFLTANKGDTMSKDIFETDEIQVTAFVGKNGSPCVQVGLKGEHEYAQLTPTEVLELAHALLARYCRIEGYRATD